jgi:hypothetical protein
VQGAMRELSGLSSGVGIRSVGGGEGLRGFHRSDSGRGPPRVGWFPLTKTPLKSPLSKGGGIFIERGAAKADEKPTCACLRAICSGHDHVAGARPSY